MTTFFLIFAVLALVLLAAVVFLVRRMLRLRRAMLNAYSSGRVEGADQPGAADQPRGVGGLTAVQTTAMANNMLKAIGGSASGRVQARNAEAPRTPPEV